MFSSFTLKDSLKLAHGLGGITSPKSDGAGLGVGGLQAGNLERPAESKGRVLAKLPPAQDNSVIFFFLSGLRLISLGPPTQGGESAFLTVH